MYDVVSLKGGQCVMWCHYTAWGCGCHHKYCMVESCFFFKVCCNKDLQGGNLKSSSRSIFCRQ